MTATLLSFDIFGTVVDWRAGLGADLANLGRTLTDADFEAIIAAQSVDESGPFRAYRDITAASLVRVLGLDPTAADTIGANVGRWPLFPDSREALRQLQAVVPCVAMTNSDRAHGEQVQEQLGFRLTDWVCAEEIRLYKPRPDFWQAVAARRGIEPGPRWWHVSAYGDYDLTTTQRLGLTGVFVTRPHSVPGPAEHTVADLGQLVSLVGA